MHHIHPSYILYISADKACSGNQSITLQEHSEVRSELDYPVNSSVDWQSQGQRPLGVLQCALTLLAVSVKVHQQTLTCAKVVALGQIEGLQPVLADVQVQPIPQEDRLHVAGVAVSSLGSKETQRLVVGRVTASAAWKREADRKTWQRRRRLPLELQLRSPASNPRASTARQPARLSWRCIDCQAARYFYTQRKAEK